MKKLWFLLFILSAMAVAGQSTPEVDITAEPNHHLLFENQYVRAFLAEVQPGAATLMHRHRHDYVFVSLGASEISNEVESKAPVTLKMQDGETRFAAGGFAHLARNLSSTPFRAIAVEFMQDEAAHSAPQPKWDEDRGLHVFNGGTQEILFVNDGVRVSETELQPGGMLPSHHHSGPHLLIAVSDLEVRSDVEGQGAMPGHFKSGEVKWLPGGYTHTLSNVGKQEAKFVTLEFP